MNGIRQIAFIGFLLCVPLMVIAAQKHGAEPSKSATAQAQESHPTNPNTAAGQEIARESEAAAGEEGTEFKQSEAVKWFARTAHVDPHVAYWILLATNFAIIAGAIYWVSKSKLTAALRARTAEIQKGIAEARKASEDANRRLSEVEARLAKLGTEIEQMRTASETESQKEEQRIRASAEEDSRKVIELAEQEIIAASKSAQQQLRSFAADLAVNLAEKRISVDARTDEALVRSFVEQLGKDGR